MAKTKNDYYNEGRSAAEHGAPASANPGTIGSWQCNAWQDGWQKGKACHDAVKEVSHSGGLAQFPAKMPASTRHHVSLLSQRALSTKDSTLALRLDRKITKLHERWA